MARRCMRFLFGLGRQRGAGAGSVHIAGSFFVAGVPDLRFPEHLFTRPGQGGLRRRSRCSWSATFLTVQVLWIGGTQTLGRYVAEREAQGSDWGPVVSSVRRWQIGLAVAFVLGALLASPLLTRQLFGSAWLTVGVHRGRCLLRTRVLPAGHLQRAQAVASAWRADRGGVGGRGCSSQPCCSP